MSSMTPVNHGPQLLDEENNPLGFEEESWTSGGKKRSMNLYISSYVTGAEVRDKANGKWLRWKDIKKHWKAGRCKKKKKRRSYKQCQVAWFAGNLSGRLNKCDKRRAKATVAERGGDTCRERRDKGREERTQVDQLWQDYFSIFGRWKK